MNPMNRRTFLERGLETGLGSALGATALASTAAARAASHQGAFQLRYAPHFGMFKHSAGDDPIDQLKFMADEGFTALEDNGMPGRPVELQEKIAREMERLNLQMGVFVAHASFGEKTFVWNDTGTRERIAKDMHDAVEVAKRVNARWCTVVPNAFDPHLEWDYQTANVIENLKRAAEICEPAGLTMVLEPLNAWTDHPGLFLTEMPQAYMICRAVGSPSCKILDDLYHQQVTEGNLIPNIDRSWDEIAYFQVGDNPGRKEPTTGEVNFKNVFQHLHAKGYTGIVGMEHGNSQPGKEGERAVIEAYRACDAF